MIQNVTKTVPINNVFTDPYGGAVIVGVPVGELDELPCMLSYHVVTRLPRVGEFWRVEGTIVENPQRSPQLTARSCRPVGLPNASYVTRLLWKHPGFRGFGFGPEKIRRLVVKFGEEGLIQLLDDGNVHRLREAIPPPIAEELVNAWQEVEGLTKQVRELRSTSREIEPWSTF